MAGLVLSTKWGPRKNTFENHLGARGWRPLLRMQLPRSYPELLNWELWAHAWRFNCPCPHSHPLFLSLQTQGNGCMEWIQFFLFFQQNIAVGWVAQVPVPCKLRARSGNGRTRRQPLILETGRGESEWGPFKEESESFVLSRKKLQVHDFSITWMKINITLKNCMFHNQ